jgi:glycosyltransferase involved in cell wall biosynthesis
MNPPGEHKALRVAVLASHPIQYQAPWFRALAKEVDLRVYFAHQPGREEQGEGFGKAFEWDVDLLEGYSHHFLENRSKRPGTASYGGCDTPEIAARIAKGDFDAFIVSGWYLKCYWQAVNACRKAGIPVLVRGDSQLMTPRSKLKEWVKAAVYRRMLKRFDAFLTVGERNREYLRHYGVPEEKLFTAPHFIDNDWFASKASNEYGYALALRAEWQASERDVVVAFVGKFISKKRPTDLIEAMADVKSTIDCRLVCIGSGILERELRELAARLSVAVNFVGFKNQSELPSHYAAADVVVLASDGGETWGLVVNEAMACGTPIIASDACGCVPDLIESGVTGFSYPCGDVEALAKCLERIVELKKSGHDWKPGLRDKLRSYSVETCTSGTLNAVHQLMAQRSSKKDKTSRF